MIPQFNTATEERQRELEARIAPIENRWEGVTLRVERPQSYDGFSVVATVGDQEITETAPTGMMEDAIARLIERVDAAVGG